MLTRLGDSQFLGFRKDLLVFDSQLLGDLLLGAVVGVDVLLGREWTIGVEVRPHVMVLHLDSEPFDLAAMVRVQHLFEL